MYDSITSIACQLQVAKKISEQAGISVISLLRNGIFLREEETFGMTVEAAASLERPAVSSDHVVPTYEGERSFKMARFSRVEVAPKLLWR